MVRNIRNIFHRAGLMAHEVRTLQGIVTGLTERPHIASAKPAKARGPGTKGRKRRSDPEK